jgi:hypothetical protein
MSEPRTSERSLWVTEGRSTIAGEPVALAQFDLEANEQSAPMKHDWWLRLSSNICEQAYLCSITTKSLRRYSMRCQNQSMLPSPSARMSREHRALGESSRVHPPRLEGSVTPVSKDSDDS